MILGLFVALVPQSSVDSYAGVLSYISIALGVFNGALLFYTVQLFAKMMSVYKPVFAKAGLMGTYYTAMEVFSNYIIKLVVLEVAPHFSNSFYFASFA
jgi:hypothetical protein